MSEVKRYKADADGYAGEVWAEMKEAAAGEWIKASDYAALRAENERLREEIERRFTVDEHERLVAKGQEINRNFIGSLSAELAALKAVPDEVEVAAWRIKGATSSPALMSNGAALFNERNYPGSLADREPLMTVAQHNAIVASLSAENQRVVPAPPLLADRHPMDLHQPVADEQEAFCNGHCTWLDHHPGCVRSAPAGKLAAVSEQEPAGYFVQPYTDRPEAIERVDDSCAGEEDVFPLYRHPPAAQQDVIVADVREAFDALLNWAERQVCIHESTHRGGSIWEICDDCGGRWADDMGGKPAFLWPKEIEQARAALSAPAAGQGVSALVEAAETARRANKWWAENPGSPIRALTHFVRAADAIGEALAAHKAGGV